MPCIVSHCQLSTPNYWVPPSWVYVISSPSNSLTYSSTTSSSLTSLISNATLRSTWVLTDIDNKTFHSYIGCILLINMMLMYVVVEGISVIFDCQSVTSMWDFAGSQPISESKIHCKNTETSQIIRLCNAMHGSLHNWLKNNWLRLRLHGNCPSRSQHVTHWIRNLAKCTKKSPWTLRLCIKSTNFEVPMT